MLRTLLTILICLNLCSYFYGQCDNPHPDYEALMAFYNSTNGPNWEDRKGWQEGAAGEACNPCSFQGGGAWSGIICNLFNGIPRVTSLDLTQDENMQGKIPAEIGSLEELAFLVLLSNSLKGEIPEQIGDLENLVVLNLSSNQLTGIIPGKIGLLKNLETLDLSFNQLSGEISKEIAKLPSIDRFWLRYNNLSGCIPDSLVLLCDREVVNGNIILDLSNNDNLPFRGDVLRICNGEEQIGAPCLKEGQEAVINDNCECVIENQDCTSTNHPDYEALMALYNSTDGANWTNNDGWKEGAAGESCDPCKWNGSTWYGISCENNRVVCIDLDGDINCDLGNILDNNSNQIGNNLNGTLPPVIWNELSELRILDLSNNEIGGEIPIPIGDIDIGGRWSIDLSHNNLQGTIPDICCGTLKLNNNNLEGCPDLDWGFYCDWELNILNNPQLIYGGVATGLSVFTPNFSFCDAIFAAGRNDELVQLTEELLCNEDLDLICSESFEILESLETFIIGSPCTKEGEQGVLNENCECIIQDTDCVSISHLDYDALIALYISTDGANWINNDGWKEGAAGESCDPCDFIGMPWFGLECDDSGNVERVDLNTNNLSGQIPAEIFDLVHLKRLALHENQLIGEFPSNISGLSESIVEIDIWDNQITGEIPKDLSKLISLDEIDFGRNQFTGEIPEEFYVLTNLISITFEDNQLSGKISENISNLKNLRYLYIGNNQFSGELPFEIGELSTLNDLYLNDNFLIGGIPQELSKLENLEVLKLNNNLLTGCFPDEILNMCSIRVVDFSENLGLSWQGDFSRFCSGEEQMGSLCLLQGDVAITNSDCSCEKITDEVCALSTWEDLFLKDWWSSIDSSGLYWTKYCKDHSNANFELQIDLASNGTDSIVGILFSDPESSITLIDVDVYSCSGDLISSCENGCPYDKDFLENIFDGYSSYSNSGQLEVQNCLGCTESNHPDFQALITLYNSTDGPNWTNNDGWREGASGESCDPCNFNGSSWYGIRCENNRVTCIDLDEIDDCSFSNRGGNNLNGEIPISIGELSLLRILELEQNNLTGGIPASIQDLKNLQVLNLSGNVNLGGSLPNEIGELTSLKTLRVEFCGLRGEIPSEIGRINGLETFFAYGNELTGAIPETMSNLLSLKRIWLSTNDLSGCIPDDLFKICNNEFLRLGNNPQLPFGGDENLLCLNNEQVGAPCLKDGQEAIINDNCECVIENQDCLSTNHPDYQALISIYDSLNGQDWEQSTDGWKEGKEGTSCNPCDFNGFPWHRVICQNNRVTEILLTGANSERGVKGVIPESIGQLEALQSLSINGFDLEESALPQSIGLLKDLTYLQIDLSNLGGQIPAEFWSLVNLDTILLDNNKLIGALSSEISNLSSLQCIYLGGNLMTGELPIELAALPNLQCVSFGSNNFSGCIPEEYVEFCRKSNGIYDFQNNPLLPWQGDFARFCNGEQQVGAPCVKDGQEAIINNSCECVIENQDCSSVNHPDYEALMALYNSTDGPNWTNNDGWREGAAGESCDPCNFNGRTWTDVNCKNNRVWQIGFSGNNLDGTLPSDLALDSLEQFVILSENIVGPYPNFNNLPNLKTLTLGDNNFDPSPIPDFDKLPQLEFFNSTSNNHIGSLPSFKNTKLKDIQIWNNNITGNIPSEWSNLPLERIFLFSNQLSGEIPEFIFNSIFLKKVDMSNNKLNGCFNESEEICLLGFTAELGEDGYNFTSNMELPWQGDFARFCNEEEQIGAPCLKDGQEAIINDNCECVIENQDCSSINHPDYVALMALYNSTDGANWTNNEGWREGAAGESCDPCEFNGESWQGIRCDQEGRIIRLDLQKNNLIGQIPLTLYELDQLHTLWLNGNQISGTIDQSISNLSNLVNLDFQKNLLTGDIPPSLWSINSLFSVWLNENQLSGELPQSISDLTLQVLNLSNNLITGLLPEVRTDSLNALILDENNFSGCFPVVYAQLCDNTSGDYRFSDNPLLPWQGDFPRFCGEEEQVGASCIINGQDAIINDNCECAVGVDEPCIENTVVLDTTLCPSESLFINERTFTVDDNYFEFGPFSDQAGCDSFYIVDVLFLQPDAERCLEQNGTTILETADDMIVTADAPAVFEDVTEETHSLLIYNRWGNKVFQVMNPPIGFTWDGTYQRSGNMLPEGTYYFLLFKRSENGEGIKPNAMKSGFITLLR